MKEDHNYVEKIWSPMELAKITEKDRNRSLMVDKIRSTLQ